MFNAPMPLQFDNRFEGGRDSKPELVGEFSIAFPNRNQAVVPPHPVASLVCPIIPFDQYLPQPPLNSPSIIRGKRSRFCFVHVDDIWWKTILVLLLAPDPNLVGVTV